MGEQHCRVIPERFVVSQEYALYSRGIYNSICQCSAISTSNLKFKAQVVAFLFSWLCYSQKIIYLSGTCFHDKKILKSHRHNLRGQPRVQDFEDDIYLGDPALLRYQLVISILKVYFNNVLAPCLLRLMVLFNLLSIVIV